MGSGPQQGGHMGGEGQGGPQTGAFRVQVEKGPASPPGREGEAVYTAVLIWVGQFPLAPPTQHTWGLQSTARIQPRAPSPSVPS